uniref:KRAB domain-containing protein n=1 Tax=Marmota marmota marmota TaxID=9994 RepID=A0A8C5ZPY6_MARMA
MAAIDLSHGLLSTEPVCFYEEKTNVERMVTDYQANYYQVKRKGVLPQKWTLLAPVQRNLYSDVVLENYQNLATVGRTKFLWLILV